MRVLRSAAVSFCVGALFACVPRPAATSAGASSECPDLLAWSGSAHLEWVRCVPLDSWRPAHKIDGDLLLADRAGVVAGSSNLSTTASRSARGFLVGFDPRGQTQWTHAGAFEIVGADARRVVMEDPRGLLPRVARLDRRTGALLDQRDIAFHREQGVETALSPDGGRLVVRPDPRGINSPPTTDAFLFGPDDAQGALAHGLPLGAPPSYAMRPLVAVDPSGVTYVLFHGAPSMLVVVERDGAVRGRHPIQESDGFLRLAVEPSGALVALLLGQNVSLSVARFDAEGHALDRRAVADPGCAYDGQHAAAVGADGDVAVAGSGPSASAEMCRVGRSGDVAKLRFEPRSERVGDTLRSAEIALSNVAFDGAGGVLFSGGVTLTERRLHQDAVRRSWLLVARVARE